MSNAVKSRLALAQANLTAKQTAYLAAQQAVDDAKAALDLWTQLDAEEEDEPVATTVPLAPGVYRHDADGTITPVVDQVVEPSADEAQQ